MLTPAELGYAAGVMDSDGSISIGKWSKQGPRPYYYVDCVVVMADPRVPEWFHDHFGGYVMVKSYASANRRTIWLWRAKRSKVEELLEQIRPYLVFKRDQAWLALEFRAQCGGVHFGKGAPISDEHGALQEGFYLAMKGMH